MHTEKIMYYYKRISNLDNYAYILNDLSYLTILNRYFKKICLVLSISNFVSHTTLIEILNRSFD